MEEPHTPDGDRQRGGSRGRTGILVLLPPAFLGAAYFLFVEYVLREPLAVGASTRFLLRLGGAGLVVLSLILAAACGYLLGERFLRPLRLLLRLAESGEMQPDRAETLRARGREYLDLHRLLRVLVNQNKAGARAMEELDELRSAHARFRDEFSRTGLHGIPPEVSTNGPMHDVAVQVQARRNNLLSFFRDLRERVGKMRLELEELGAALGLDAGTAGSGDGGFGDGSGGCGEEGAPDAGLGLAVAARVERLRQLGTVLALESARSAGLPAPRAAELLDRFHAGLGELESILESLPGVAGTPPAGSVRGILSMAPESREGLRDRWRRALDGIESFERRLDEVEER